MPRPRAALVRTCLSLLAGFLLLGCTLGQDRGAPAAAPAPQPTVAAPAPTAKAATSPAATRPQSTITPEVIPPQEAGAYRGIESVVARIRGLNPTRDVDLRFMSQAELHQYFVDAFERDYPPDERARDQKLLTILGLIRPDQDLATTMLNLLSEQVIGLYDDDTRRMYLIGAVAEPTPASKVTFAHEFTHALQDQYYNLKALNPPETDDDDRSAAIQALVEGDATQVMLIYARDELTAAERRQYLQEQTNGGSDALSSAPLVLRTELLFPYTDGLRFVQTLYLKGGFAAVDAAFRDPPQSTEQIIHPEKYAAREAPVPIALPDLAAALGPDWRQTAVNTLGELDLRILVEQFSDHATATRAAAGWAGDRYALLEDGNGQAAVAIKSSWDSSQDAQEFFDAYSRAIRTRFGPGARTLIGEPARLALVGSGYAASAELDGQQVRIVLAPDESVMTTLARALAGP